MSFSLALVLLPDAPESLSTSFFELTVALLRTLDLKLTCMFWVSISECQQNCVAPRDNVHSIFVLWSTPGTKGKKCYVEYCM